MNDIESSTQSIFNIIEERKDTPQIFTWTDTFDIFQSSDTIYEGILIENQCSCKYILTLKGLYRYKVYANVMLG